VGAFGSLDISGDIDVDGTANLDIVDIDGAVNIAAAVTQSGGVFTQDGGAVFNEGSADVDFRVESNGNANMLFVDGGNNRVGVGTNIPSVEFEIADSNSDCEMTIGSWADNINTKSALNFVKSRNTTIGTGAATSAADNLGEILAYGYDTGNTARAASQILFQGDAAPDGDAVPGRILFKTSNAAALQTALTIDDSQDAVFAAKISSTGDTTITGGDLVFATAGKGVVLGATSNTDANTLDDYEEGTWTPSVAVGQASVSVGTVHQARYSRIGKTVTLCACFDVTADDPDSGDVRFAGLPFPLSLPNGGFPVSILYNYTATPTLFMSQGGYVYYQNDTVGGNNQQPLGGALHSTQVFSMTFSYITTN